MNELTVRHVIAWRGVLSEDGKTEAPATPEAVLQPGPGSGQGLAAAQPESARACAIIGSRS